MRTASALAAAFPVALVAEAALASTFPEIVIRKGEVAHEWAFSIDEGTLTCVPFGGERHVFFAEILSDEETFVDGTVRLPRSVVVTVNPIALFVTVENRELYAPFDTLETLIRRLAPFYDMGRALCDEPARTKS
ncbi:MAG: hypothetical protein KF723_16835 [Rhizobiaceae bacterium]|nr:hypothetical protein [Rhizobiaceae bacterium]